MNTQEIIGLPQNVTEGKLMESGYHLRIMEQDGQYLIGTCDYWPNRINVAIEKGVVKKVLGVG
jgi:hypothetical protein